MKMEWMMAALLGLAFAMPLSAADRDVRHDATMADLTASYNVQQSEIQNLRDKGWSWNDIGTALAISKRSGQPLQELVAQKDSGMGWNEIADKGGFKASEVRGEAKQLAKDFKRAERQARRGDAIRTGAPLPSDERPSGASTPGDERDNVGPGTETDPTGTRNPTSQGPNYPQNPSGPGDNQSVTPSGNP